MGLDLSNQSNIDFDDELEFLCEQELTIYDKIFKIKKYKELSNFRKIITIKLYINIKYILLIFIFFK